MSPQPRAATLGVFAVLALAASVVSAWGAAGELDTTFQTTGFVKTEVRGDDHAYSMAVQPDGKVVVVGSTLSADYTNSDFAVVRYLPSGALDTTFGTGGKVMTGIGTGNDIAFDVAIQADGKIVVAGETNDSAGSNANFAVVRYNANGTLDTTFNTTGKVVTGIGSLDDYATCIGVQSDGKIVVGGYTYISADSTNFALARYNSNGALDTAFNTTGKVSTDLGGVEVAEALTVQASGKILVAGFTSNVAGDYANNALVRYNANGSLDTTFNTTGKVITNMGPTYNYIDAIAVQADGKIVTAGSMVEAGVGVARYTTSGVLDTSFNGSGKIITPFTGAGEGDVVHSVAVQGDGKIVVAGSTRVADGDDVALVRFTSSGSVDAGFGNNGVAITNFSADAGPDSAYAVRVLSDGALLVAGDTSTSADGYDLLIAKYQVAGAAVLMPLASTLEATNITRTSADLQGSVNAKGISTTVSFEYGLTTDYGSTIAATPGSLTSSTDTAVMATLGGLQEATTYHYRVKAVTADGVVLGADRSFTTDAPPPPEPPVITLSPTSITAEAGTSFALSVQATGDGLTYLWKRNGTSVTGGTASTLNITNFQSAQAGNYVCVVTNAAGVTATSGTAVLTLVSNFNTAVDLTTTRWQTTSPSPWSVVTTGARDGVDALKSGSPAAGGSSKCSAIITGPVRLTYYYKVTATSGAALLRCLVDGAQVSEATGTVDWTLASILVPTGAHQLEFSFDQTTGTGAGEAAWIDQMAASSPSWITSQPQSRIVNLGSSVTFDVALDGLTTTCQWRKNGVAIAGATSNQFTISNVATTDAALYTVALGTGTISSAASLSVVKPTMYATAPLAKTAVFAQTLTNATGATFQWQRAGVNLVDGTKFAGARTASLSVKLLTAADEGADYSCIIKLGTLTHTVGPCELAILPKPVIDPVAAQQTIISGSYRLELKATPTPTSWSVVGLPSGLTYSTTTGVISGAANVADKLTGPYAITVAATNAAGASDKVTFPLSVAIQPPGTAGAWWGLVARQTALNADLGGSFVMNVTGTGTFTGTLRNGKDTHPLAGRVITDVATQRSSGTQTIVRTGRTPLVVSFTLDPATASLSGTINSAGEVAAVDASRNSWTAPLPAPAGLYNNALELPLENVGDASTPQGAGWTQLTVAALGTVTISGRLADGTAFTSTTIMGSDRRVPLFQLLYTNHGSLRGWQVIGVDEWVSSDDLTWVKTGPISTADKTYASGYIIALNSSGAKYVKPTTTQPIVLALPDQADNAMVQFSGAEIETAAKYADLAQVFRVSKTNVATFRTATTGNPCAVKMTFVPTTGLFSGSFTLTDPGTLKPIVRIVSYYGVLLSHRREGVGCFVLPGLATGSAIQSGLVSLMPTGL